MKYFSGSPSDLGNVTALPFKLFSELRPWLEQPKVIPHTREQYHKLEAKERATAKRVAYITPCAFTTSPSPRRTENVSRCNLLALDIDDGEEADRLLRQGWTNLGSFGFVAWHTASSTPDHPRIRVLVSADGLAPQRYGPAVETIAQMLGLAEVTRESLVAVQPMFLPTTFIGEKESPIIAANFEGEAFTVADILEPHELTQDGQAAPTDDEVANIEFLSAPIDNVTLKDAEEALGFLDPDCSMQEWIEIAAGLKHQFQAQDAEALALWDAWSAKGKKYVDSAETAYRWSTLKGQPVNRAPITLRSVFRKATARGWTNAKLAKRAFEDVAAWISSPSRSTEQLNDEAIQRIAKITPVVSSLERSSLLNTLSKCLRGRNMTVPMGDLKKELRRMELEEARTTGIPAWAKNIYYVTALNTFYRPSVDRRFSPEVLDIMYCAPKIGDTDTRPRDYLTKIIGIPQVENLRYDPASGDKRFITIENVPYVNTYRPSPVKPDPERADEAGALFSGHLTNLIRDKKHCATLLDYLAFIHQHPGKKIRWAPLIQSTKGAGKTFIAVALAATLGRRNVKKVDPAIVMDSKHNDWAYGAQVVVMEEVRIIGQNRHSVMDRLKPCISDDEICIRRMYEPPQTVPNITNYLMFTNHHDSLAVQDDERRYFVLSSPIQRPSDVAALGGAAYFNRLFEMVRDNSGGLRYFFENYKISKEFNHEGRAPLTDHFLELVENSATPLAAAVKLAIADGPVALVQPDLVSLTSLRHWLSTQNIPPFSDQALSSVFREMGWVKHGRYLIEHERHQLWAPTVIPDPLKMALARLAQSHIAEDAVG